MGTRNASTSKYQSRGAQRIRLIGWVNECLLTQIERIDQLRTGAAYCQLMHMLFPQAISIRRVKFIANLEHEYVANFKILQAAFDYLSITTTIQVEDLVRGRGNFEFLLWFKIFYDANCDDKTKIYDAKAVRGGVDILIGPSIRTLASSRSKSMVSERLVPLRSSSTAGTSAGMSADTSADTDADTSAGTSADTGAVTSAGTSADTSADTSAGMSAGTSAGAGAGSRKPSVVRNKSKCNQKVAITTGRFDLGVKNVRSNTATSHRLRSASIVAKGNRTASIDKLAGPSGLRVTTANVSRSGSCVVPKRVNISCTSNDNPRRSPHKLSEVERNYWRCRRASNNFTYYEKLMQIRNLCETASNDEFRSPTLQAIIDICADIYDPSHFLNAPDALVVDHQSTAAPHDTANVENNPSASDAANELPGAESPVRPATDGTQN